ncbi:hypothetical protein EDEG_02577 [Edhazardia aedis USNM 41457]|uniref:Uncharacterized protein n=1 Tax=Edhazardia aedis (strain USNM 41457) TaxID=1003232 RepID=J9D5G7_EDHAE|nr:hypothetical protein EDEG_02577 [Edhazardia aedis USNM 41457]|eukprot:EJW03036.1 hypothetical protein EDEG_02577 [Edhazardia aedis USNM 41457]
MINPFFLMKTFFRYLIEIRQYLLYGILLVSPQQSSTNPINVYGHQEHGVEIISNADNYTGNILCDSMFSYKPIDIKHLDEDEENVVHFSESDLQFDMNMNRPERFRRTVSEVKKDNDLQNTIKNINMTLDYFEKQIDMNNHTIFDLYDVYSIFDILSTKENIIEEFVLKKKLHQMLLNRADIQYVFDDVGEMRQLYEQKDIFDNFYEQYLRLKYVYNDKKIEHHNMNESYKFFYCAHDDIKNLAEYNIDLKHNLQELNDNFILRFNNHFKLYWQNFFYTLNNAPFTDEIKEYIGTFYDLNKNFTTVYDLKNLYFKDMVKLSIDIPSNKFKKRIYLRFNSLYKDRFQKLLNLRNFLKRKVEDFFKYENPQIEFRNLFRKNLNESDIVLTLYGEHKLLRLSKNIGQIISNALNNETMPEDPEIKNQMNNEDKTMNVEEFADISEHDDNNYISIEVWDWALNKECENNVCNHVCANDISVYVGLIVSI